MEYEKLDNSNLWDKTYHLLKESIIRRQFAPNHKISIPEISEKLGISRTPIRDALNRLEKDGLVVTISKIGTFVKGIDHQTALEITDSRMMLEYWSLRHALRDQESLLLEGISKLDMILQQAEANISQLSLDEYLKRDYNFAFHLELVQMGNNRTNTEIYTNLMNYRHILFNTHVVSFEMITQANKEHEGIVAALKKRDEADILQRIEDHLQASKAVLLEKIKHHGDMI
ncbi:GntR family transcriptional regulator [Paenibacillus psychroresistens]|uniref:GntR family transcriptional regulator n=1 Tax=Paenibacillus psychroresistens TaxID=1778678 RepID=A0A6B8RV27_9BACL|nr:GntR family transcriptional regulator [Paenibacillus psychroresistens]QGQ99475.1 GntR family transcriptional regulator [Paenibacillus psychroresistens]